MCPKSFLEIIFISLIIALELSSFSMTKLPFEKECEDLYISLAI